MADDLAHATSGTGPTEGAAVATGTTAAVPAPAQEAASAAGARRPHGSPLLEAIRAHEAAFRAGRHAGDAPAMVGAILALEAEMWSWRADTQQSDEMDRGRAALRAMVSELGAVAEVGTRDPTTVVAPFIDLALALRSEARAGGRYDDADGVRDRLTALGVEVHDTAEGVTWELS